MIDIKQIIDATVNSVHEIIREYDVWNGKMFDRLKLVNYMLDDDNFDYEFSDADVLDIFGLKDLETGKVIMRCNGKFVYVNIDFGEAAKNNGAYEPCLVIHYSDRNLDYKGQSADGMILKAVKLKPTDAIYQRFMDEFMDKCSE